MAAGIQDNHSDTVAVGVRAVGIGRTSLAAVVREQDSQSARRAGRLAGIRKVPEVRTVAAASRIAWADTAGGRPECRTRPVERAAEDNVPVELRKMPVEEGQTVDGRPEERHIAVAEVGRCFHNTVLLLEVEDNQQGRLLSQSKLEVDSKF